MCHHLQGPEQISHLLMTHPVGQCVQVHLTHFPFAENALPRSKGSPDSGPEALECF